MSNDECKDAIATIKTLTLNIKAIQERNDIISKENKTKQDTYDAYEKDYTQKLLPEWDKKRQAELDRLRYERRTWNNCIDGNLFCTKREKTDQWCANEVGFGWEFSNCEQNNCGIYRKGVCKRTDDQSQKELETWESNNPPPTEPRKPELQPSIPYPPINVSLNCCKNIQLVQDSTITNSDLNQLNSCIAELETAVSNTSNNTTTNNNQQIPPQQQSLQVLENKSNNTLIYLVLGGLVLGGFVLLK